MKMIRVLPLVLSALALVAAPGCGAGDRAGVADTDGAEAAADPLPDFALLKKPHDPAMNETASGVFQVRLTTTRGDIVIEAHREWSPHGADRFYNLAKAGFFDGIKFFRVIKGFMVQFGIHGDPDISRFWANATIQDDPVVKSNTRGFVSFAMGGPHTRSTQFFINYGDNKSLDGQGFSPFGKVIEGMEVAESLFSEYAGQPQAAQSTIQRQGNAFLDEKFPKLDSILTGRVIED
jgi:peptidyl-prolyl cis-trans isomerase A (cyclophilin A)